MLKSLLFSLSIITLYSCKSIDFSPVNTKSVCIHIQLRKNEDRLLLKKTSDKIDPMHNKKKIHDCDYLLIMDRTSVQSFPLADAAGYQMQQNVETRVNYTIFKINKDKKAQLDYILQNPDTLRLSKVKNNFPGLSSSYISVKEDYEESRTYQEQYYSTISKIKENNEEIDSGQIVNINSYRKNPIIPTAEYQEEIDASEMTTNALSTDLYHRLIIALKYKKDSEKITQSG